MIPSDIFKNENYSDRGMNTQTDISFKNENTLSIVMDLSSTLNDIEYKVDNNNNKVFILHGLSNQLYPCISESICNYLTTFLNCTRFNIEIFDDMSRAFAFNSSISPNSLRIFKSQKDLTEPISEETKDEEPEKKKKKTQD